MKPRYLLLAAASLGAVLALAAGTTWLAVAVGRSMTGDGATGELVRERDRGEPAGRPFRRLREPRVTRTPEPRLTRTPEPEPSSVDRPTAESTPRGDGGTAATPREDGGRAATPPGDGVDWPRPSDLTGSQPLTTTAHFAVYPADPDDRLLRRAAERWAPELEDILAADAYRAGRGLARSPVAVVFARAYEARCPARGLAQVASETPRIDVFVEARTTPAQIRAVLAHEIGHHIAATDRFVGDPVLTEGVASYIAGEPMLAWQGVDSWDEAVRDALADGTYISIADPDAQIPEPGEDCLERRDRVYNARTSFVAWLARRYGLAAVLAMPYREVPGPTPEGGGPPSTVRVPDYVAATGMDLPALERRWLDEVRADGS